MFSGNKGEWSEVYTLIKLLAEGEVYAADASLQKKADIYYPIIKIIRDELDDTYHYERNSSIKIKNSSGDILAEVDLSVFQEKAPKLLDKIKKGEGSSFTINAIEGFLRDIQCTTLKAKSSDKRDITLVVHDLITKFKPELGLSIKSQLGGKSTLFNASQSTNITFRVQGKNIKSSLINEKPGVKGKVKEIYSRDGKLVYDQIENKTFLRNLQVVDSALPKIIGEMAELYFRGEGKDVKALTDKVKISNPCDYNFGDGQPFYEYKIKSFLNDSAVGLRATEPWLGKYDATGGYLVVREDGEIVCYHIYNINEFQEYLFENTFFDSPSSSRHKFGKMYEEQGQNYIKLNFQIRFD
jgi:hypothetical protein